MFITNILLKKVKSKNVMVLMESVVSGHQCTRIRERLGDKLEFKMFDPYSAGLRCVQQLADKEEISRLCRPVMGKVRPAGQLRPAKAFNPARRRYFDMNIQTQSLYKERKKIRSMKSK